MNKKKIGDKGEKEACNYLTGRGYSVDLCNYSSKYGEIDIIAKKEQYIIFVEVKTRKENAAVSGLYAVDKNKQKRVIRTAADYMKKNKTELQPRFDVIEVTNNAAGNKVKINHIENAFFALESDSFETV